MLTNPVPTVLPQDVTRSLIDVFMPGEGVLGSVSSLAGSLVLTDRRVLIVREGRGYRPQTGIRSWEIGPETSLTYGSPRGGLGRLMIGTGKAATSFFVKARDWDAAMRLVSIAHGIAQREATTDRTARAS
jgi:hypothetical protein